MVTPSQRWMEERPSSTLNDYVHAMQQSTPEVKRERFLDALAPGRPKGYFKWSKTGDNGFLLAVWGVLASIPLFGLILVTWTIWTRQ